MNKSIEYYMTLNYEVKTEMIPTEEGGGWTAWIPLLGEYFCVGDGDTEEEAIEDLMKWRAECFKILIEKGIPVPEPRR